ncbi:MAG TPA: MlaD family protein [Planctomycetota bacterium]|nr:MlaD family protein [Planctomycetota bacterium]
MRTQGREVIVGLVFFALMGLLGFITLTVGSEVFSETEPVSFRFENARGLAEGSEVWVNGVPSGTVKKLVVQPNGTVEASALLRNPISALDISRGAVVEVREKSALGGAVISIETLAKHDGKAPRSLNELQGRIWPTHAGGFGAIGETAVDRLVKASEESPAFLGKALLGPGGVESLTKSIERFERMTADAEAGRGTLGLLLRDEGTATSLKNAIANIEKFTDRAANGKGLLARLIDDPATADRFDRLLADLQDLTGGLREGKGTLGLLIKDEALYHDLRAIAGDVRRFTDGLGEANGLLPRLLRDEAMARDFEGMVAEARGTFTDLREIAAGVREGKGSLGKLVNDDALYEDISDAVRSLQRSFEESRENAPILTFAGFLFRAF